MNGARLLYGSGQGAASGKRLCTNSDGSASIVNIVGHAEVGEYGYATA